MYMNLIILLSILGVMWSHTGIIAQPPDSTIWSHITSNDIAYKCSERIKQSELKEQAAFQYSIISNDRKARTSYRNQYEKVNIEGSEDYFTSDAISSIKSYLYEHNPSIIALNEAHHRSDHRWIGTALLPLLYDYGIRHIAIEGLDKIDTSLNRRGYPKMLLSGYYLFDPEYANFVRIALKMGFELIAYDEPSKGPEREWNSALNICESLSAKSINKVFIYCGFDHIQENSNSLVSILAEIYDTNPFTISQTEHQGKPFKYTPVLCSEAFTLVDRNSVDYNNIGKGLKYYSGEQNKVDMSIFTIHEYLNRQSVSHLLPYYKKITPGLPLNRIKSEFFPFQIRAYETDNQTKLSIPIDIASIDSYNDVDNYLLNILTFYKSYHITYIDCIGNEFYSQDITLGK